MSTKLELAQQLTRELCDYSSLDQSPELLDRLEILLADFMICVASGNRLANRRSLLKGDGAVGLATYFASQSAYEDKDDLDWSAINHPGSVVFAASLATTIEYPEFRGNFRQSALAGMRASASAAHFFGASHRRRWHITATAGTFGAVSAASAAIGLDSAHAERALHLAATNMGGIGQVSRELHGTPRFNRAAAAALGVAASFAAFEEVPTIKNLWDGDRGLLEIFELEGVVTEGRLIKDGVQTVRVRTFPATGFIQSALLGVAELSRAHSAPLKQLTVTVNQGVFPLLSDPARDRWWNLQSNAAAAWASKDPMQLAPAPEVEALVTAAGGEIPLGSALITGATEAGTFESRIDVAPGLQLRDPQEIAWREQKWQNMVGNRYVEVVELTKSLVRGATDTDTWSHVDDFLRGE